MVIMAMDLCMSLCKQMDSLRLLEQKDSLLKKLTDIEAENSVSLVMCKCSFIELGLPEKIVLMHISCHSLAISN